MCHQIPVSVPAVQLLLASKQCWSEKFKQFNSIALPSRNESNQSENSPCPREQNRCLFICTPWKHRLSVVSQFRSDVVWCCVEREWVSNVRGREEVPDPTHAMVMWGFGRSCFVLFTAKWWKIENTTAKAPADQSSRAEKLIGTRSCVRF